MARFWARGLSPWLRFGPGGLSLGSVLGQGSVLGSVLGQGVCPLGSLTRGNGMNEQGHINFQNAIIIEKAKRMLTLKSLKMKAFTWIESLSDQYSINSFTGNHAAYFKLDGFADEPEVYIRFTDAGLDFGYEAVQWNGPIPAPVPGIYTKHSLSWKEVQSLNREEQQDVMLELLLKTINTRKRQYRKCQFCGEKVAKEHRFDNDTCHGCASRQFGVVY